MWTENPEKSKLLAHDDEFVTPEYVTDVMTSLVEKESVVVDAGLRERASGAAGELGSGDSRQGTKTVQIQGGMILEVGKGKIRVVEQFNDPG